MRAHFSKRWLLVFLVTAAQCVCLLVGEGWFVDRLRTQLIAETEAEALADNRVVVSELAEVIRREGLGRRSDESRDLTEVLRLIEAARPTHAGMVCLTDARDGRLLCHARRGGGWAWHGQTLDRPILTPGGARVALSQLTPANRMDLHGRMVIGDVTRLVAVRNLPELGVNLVASQRLDSVTEQVDRTVASVHVAGLTIAFFVTTMGALLSVVILRRYESHVAKVNVDLGRLVDQRSEELVGTREAVILGLAKLAESRDDETGEHLDRIRLYVELLARELARRHPQLDAATVETLSLTSSLHDIGKVGIPDDVLLKPGALTPEERTVMQKHPLIGGDCLMAIRRRLGYDTFLEAACEIAFAHHERWDGGGYPFGLKGAEIPLSARIVSLADAYDTLTAKRVYKPAQTHEEARQAIIEGKGTHFDPQVVEAFERREAGFREILRQYTEDAAAPEHAARVDAFAVMSN